VFLTLFAGMFEAYGEPDKCSSVRDALISASADIIALQEMKLRHTDALKAKTFLPPVSLISLALTPTGPEAASSRRGTRACSRSSTIVNSNSP
jgi:hypothetical protein